MTWWHRHFGFIDFGGFDGGALIQAGWTFLQGSIPYTEVPSPLPPLFFLGAVLSFKLGGVSWSSLNWLVCVFALVTFTWSFLLLARINRAPWVALFFAVVFQGVTLLPLSWWWYNQTTSLVALLALLSGYGLARFPDNRLVGVSLAVSAALLYLSKINTAAPVSLFLAAVLLSRRESRRAALVALGSAAAADTLLFLALHLSPLAYLNLVHEFSIRLSSGGWMHYCLIDSLPLEHLFGLRVFGVLALGCLGSIWFQREAAARRDLLLWFAAALGVSYIQMAMNNDFKTGDTLYPLLLAALALPGLKPWAPLLGVGSVLILCALSLLGLGLLFGANRTRVASMGPKYYGGYGPPTIRLQDPPFFRGLATEAHFARVLQQVEAALATAGTPPNRVFFGPRLECCYAAYNRPFPKGLPIWWEKVPSSHRGDRYLTEEKTPDYLGPARWLADDAPVDPRVQHFIDADFTLCIFVRSGAHTADMTFVPGDLRAYLHDHFRQVDEPDIVLFQRTDPVTPGVGVQPQPSQPVTPRT